ncbi:hypothetical protein VNO78_15659 [Psophocarpus tetragonolobus]|uniref:Uncharacterized protein n=1 Tax=Psophocarpus tetragonolobus TaxID=3891 RepID=A0AAN9SKN1_PSOTE
MGYMDHSIEMRAPRPYGPVEEANAANPDRDPCPPIHLKFGLDWHEVRIVQAEVVATNSGIAPNEFGSGLVSQTVQFLASLGIGYFSSQYKEKDKDITEIKKEKESSEGVGVGAERPAEKVWVERGARWRTALQNHGGFFEDCSGIWDLNCNLIEMSEKNNNFDGLHEVPLFEGNDFAVVGRESSGYEIGTGEYSCAPHEEMRVIEKGL